MRQALTAILLTFATTAFAQESEITFKSTEIANGLHMIEAEGGFGGGNMAVLVGEDLVAMVDNGIVPLSAKLFAHAGETAGGSVDLLINTHVHGDHTGANNLFVEAGTVVFAHDNIRKRLLVDSAPAGGPTGLPIVTFADGVTFHVGDIEARISHVPLAHTDGDSWVHFPALNVIHAGDVLFHSLFPYIDLDNGGSVAGYLAAQREILAVADDDTQIIPGHGQLTDKAGMAADHAMLSAAYQRIKALVAEGKSDEEILASKPLADYDADFTWGFINADRLTSTIARDVRSMQK